MEWNETAIEIDESEAAYRERYALSMERLCGQDELPEGAAAEYFGAARAWILLCDSVFCTGKADRAANEALYAELSETGYETSFLNPRYAVKKLGDGYGQLLSAWYAELRGLAAFATEGKLFDMTVMAETHLQLCGAFCGSLSETGAFPALSELKDIVYYYLHDYCMDFVADELKAELSGTDSFAKRIVMEADLSDLSETSYLYRFGEWITEEELQTAALLNRLSGEEIERMAFAYTDGYLRGFAMTGKKLTGKRSVICYLPLGLERFMRAAIRQFEAAGLSVILYRHPAHLICKKLGGNVKSGFYGASNLQYVYDHKEDLALFWGDRLKGLKLEAVKAAYETLREEAAVCSGHACVEVFGAHGFVPETKTERTVFSAHQTALNRQYAREQQVLSDRYMPEEETSYNIIAWPRPAVADGDAARYAEIFREIIRINTLPVSTWQAIQQKLIDALDQAVYAEVSGKGANETRLRVALRPLADPAHETNFENCLADVNIPLGEVFTSPVLAGTNGLLHVSSVYIGDYCFRDLKLRFEEGRVADYGCANFDDREAGRKLIESVIFRDRARLPMGEFAIGTNTAAYAAACRYGILDRMPILIAEKMGPHFAVGDTCYAYEEDVMSYNPDGKAIVARENACSALRHTDPQNAYFQVHVDITLPYHELAELAAVAADGSRTVLIRDGRFVLEGTEELNDALDAIRTEG